MTACYRVGLVQQTVADLAREVRAQAIEVDFQRLQLLRGVSLLFVIPCMSAHLICVALAFGHYLLLEAVGARRPRRPVCAGFSDQPRG